MSKGWDNATLKKLKALTCKGLSTSEIGKRLGMSKNAIVGKLNRLGWNAKAGGAAAADVRAVTAKKTASKTTVTKKSAVKTTTAKKTADKKTTAKSASVKKTTTAKVTAKTGATAKKNKDDKNTTVGPKNTAVHQRIIQHSLEMANLKPNQCRWPIGDPDSEDFHFCGETVFVGKPYCYEHCKQAYQFAPPKKK